MNFYESIKNRRSIYNISNEVIVSEKKIEEIVEYSLKHIPTAFNSQSNRAVVLFEDSHKLLWDTIKDSLKKIVPEKSFSDTEKKINSFKNGYGTILYFEDTSIIKSLQEQFNLYADSFPIWSQQSNGMLQFSVWNLLEIEGLGASLQHYNIFIEEFLKQQWGISESWKLVAQMPFGKQIGLPEEKQFNDVKNNLKVIR